MGFNSQSNRKIADRSAPGVAPLEPIKTAAAANATRCIVTVNAATVLGKDSDQAALFVINPRSPSMYLATEGANMR